MSSPVVAKEFLWKFRDEITQGVAKARQAMQEAVSVAKEAGTKVSDTGEDWKKMGNDAKEAAQDTSQSLDSMKEKLLSYQDASKNIREQVGIVKEDLNGIPKQKIINLKAKATDDAIKAHEKMIHDIPPEKWTKLYIKDAFSNRLQDFKKKIHDIPEQKSIWLKIKDGFSNSLKNAQQDADNTKKSFLNLHDVIAGTFIGNAVLNGIYAIGNGLKGLIATGYQYTRQQQTMIASWNTLTGSASKGQEMVDMTNKLAISAQNSTEMVNDLNQKFYAVTNSAGKTKDLSQAVLTLQDAFNQSDASIKNFSTQWAQMVGNGKASAQDMLSIQNVFPKFRQELLAYERDATHNKNLTMQQLNDMISDGKISSKAMNDVLIGMGNKYKDATKNFTNTLDGMGRIIKTTAPRLLGALVEPFTKAQSPVYAAVSKWVSDTKTRNEFNKLGKVTSQGMAKVAQAFAGGHVGTGQIQRELDNLVIRLEEKIRTMTNIIARNAGNIKATFSIVGSIIKIFAKGAGAAIMDVVRIFGIFGSSAKNSASPLQVLSNLLKRIADNKVAIQTLGIVMLSVFTVNKYVAFLKWIQDLKKTMVFSTTIDVVKKLGSAFKFLAGTGIKVLGGLISGTKELTVANAALDIALSPITWAVVAVAALGVAFYEAYKHIKPFRDAVNKLGKAIKNTFTGKANWEKNFVKGFKSLEKDFGRIGKSIGKEASKIGKGIKNTFTGKAGWEKDLKKNFSNMQKEYQKYSKNQTRLQQREQKEQQKRWNNFWSGLTKKSHNAWDNIKKHAQNGMSNVSKTTQSRFKTIQKGWDNGWSTVKQISRGAWSNIRQHSSNGMDNVHSAVSRGLNTINHVWSSGWNSFTGFFKGIWNDIKQAAQDGMNGVINVINAGIGAINKVWSFFTGHGTGVKELGHVHFAQGGTVHRHLSVINDGDGPDWKELVQTPDGNLFMSQERNWTGFLPEGTRVYSGAETRQIMNAVGVSHYATGGIVGAQHFADGGIIGEGIDWAKGSLENIGSWLGDKFSALEDFLADPLKATKGLLEKATSGLYKGLGNFADVAHGAMDKLTQPIADWFKKGLEKLEAQFESGGASPALIRAAAAKMHVAISGADISHIMNVIKHESGGNARAINNWDSNAKAGHPSKGILQFIDGTFGKYAVAGHTNIYSPFDQLLAMFNDTTWRSDLTLGGWGPTGGRRFATGGEVFGLTNAIIGDNPEHHEFVLNPYAVSAEPLLDRAFEATAQAQPANSSTGNGNSKLDQMIDLLGKVLVAIESQNTDIYLDGEKVTDDVSKRQGKTWRLRKN
ncbi:tape measure protein [Limosilactobacillus reuteri]|uniref:tape measure protein n=1 Tax=Limosilactobacillus reuteri TaxID=1598 RepID=UPI002B062262|nr:tape measure protein [Limosilactobacillus reuteri]